jgi:transcriptional regulator with XRE-family HTH domain
MFARMGKRTVVYENQRTSLIRARERRGLSRNELADALKLSRHFVYRVEMGSRAPSHGVMVRWAEALNATMDFFRDEEGNSQARSVA